MGVVLLLSAEGDLQEAYSLVEEHRQGRGAVFPAECGVMAGTS
jgi:hypothetical protein